MANSPPPRFLSLAVRQVVLRIIVISSLSSFLINVIIAQLNIRRGFQRDGWLLIGNSIVPFAVLLHHILRLWPRQKWSVRFDFVYSAIELIAATGFLVINMFEGAYAAPFCLIPHGLFWSSVGASFVFAIWHLRASQYCRMERTYDFLENVAESNDRQNSRLGRWTLLFGHNTFKKRFEMDRIFVRRLRSGTAILCFLAMIMLGGLVLLYRPITSQSYFQTLQIPKFDSDKNVTFQAGLLVAGSGEADLNITWRPESKHVPCPAYAGQVECNILSPLNKSSPDELIITIDYTRALQQFPASTMRTGVYLSIDTRPADDPSNVTDNAAALPIQLYPGFHLFGTTFYSFQEVYANIGYFSFGIPHFNRRLMGNVQALIPDPEYATSIVDNSTATLRLTYQGGQVAQNYYTIQREQSSNSVIDGFALLGGVWTFMNGLFAAVFGCTLLLVLFGIKPLSIYGLVHSFERRRTLVFCGHTRTLTAEELNRTVVLLQEHLLDDRVCMDANQAPDNNNNNDEESKPEEVE